MSVTSKLIGAAAIGGTATYLMNGDWSRRAKARAVASSAFGWAAAVLVIHIFPDLHFAPDEAKMAVVGICCGLVGYAFDRIQGLRISAKLAGVEITSEGKSNGPE